MRVTSRPGQEDGVAYMGNRTGRTGPGQGERLGPFETSFSTRTFLLSPADLIRLMADLNFAVLCEPSLGLYFLRPVLPAARAACVPVGIGAEAVRNAVEAGLIAPAFSDEEDECLYLLTADGRRRIALDRDP